MPASSSFRNAPRNRCELNAPGKEGGPTLSDNVEPSSQKKNAKELGKGGGEGNHSNMDALGWGEMLETGPFFPKGLLKKFLGGARR